MTGWCTVKRQRFALPIGQNTLWKLGFTNRATCCKHVYMSGSVISLRVDAQQKERLDALASRTGRSGAFYLRKALDSYLDQLEYVYALESEAEAARRGELETISLEDLEAECGLVG